MTQWKSAMTVVVGSAENSSHVKSWTRPEAVAPNTWNRHVSGRNAGTRP